MADSIFDLIFGRDRFKRDESSYAYSGSDITDYGLLDAMPEKDYLQEMHPRDKVALITSPYPVVGGITGTYADAMNMYENPEERTLINAGLMATNWIPGGRASRTAVRNMDEIKDPLIVQHNTTKGALKKTEGRLPMPSIAITKAEKPLGLEQFGDITLIGKKEMIKPSAMSPVYKADAFTGRAPRDWLEYKNPEEVFNKLTDKEKEFYRIDSLASFESNFDVGDLEKAIATTELAKIKGLNPDDFGSYRELRRELENLLIKNDEYITTYTDRIGDYTMGETHRVMSNPKGTYTQTGTKRDPIPYSVENAYDVMKKKKAWTKGAEGGYPTPGLIRALSEDQFKSIPEIQKERDRIIGQYGAEDYLSFSDDVRNATDIIDEILDKPLRPVNLNTEELIKEILQGYKPDYLNLTDDQIKEIYKVVDDLKSKVPNLKTDYFEAKPRRIVDVGEFEGAIVPKGDKESIELLKEKGVGRIYEYKDKKDFDSIIDKNFRDVYFKEGLLDERDIENRMGLL